MFVIRQTLLNSVFAKQNHVRLLASCCDALTFSSHGDPNDVLKLKRIPLPPLKPDQVHIKMIAAPINPADINIIQGVYPIKPEFPAIGGYEGVGEIIKVGSEVSIFKPGDRVMPGGSIAGTWRTDIISSILGLLPIPSDISVKDAATLSVNPATAYRMLVDFEKLEEGDYIIQNGANSAVGQAIIQLSKHMKFKTINIVREREDFDELEKTLLDLGADHVITDTFLKSKEMYTFMKDIEAPKLALNCVGGRITAEIFKHMAHGGTMVTYGAMSKQPLMVPAGSLIFKDIKLKGYWMTRWTEENRNKTKRANMLKYLLSAIRLEKLETGQCRFVDIRNYASAIKKSTEGFHTEKQILYLAGNENLKSKIDEIIHYDE